MTENQEPSPEVTVPSSNSDSFTDRIRQVIGDESVRNFAKRAGLGFSTMQHIVEGGRPRVDKLVAIARAAGVTVDWLATGEGSMRPRDVAPERRAEHQAELDRLARGALEGGALPATEAQLSDQYVFLPRYGVQAGAGAGRDASVEPVVERLAFRRDWVRNVLRLEPRNLVLIEAHGNSMVPTFKSGDILMVHTAETKLRHGLVYAMSVDGDLVVKRVDRRADGTLVLRSDNPDFPPEEIPPGRADQLRIIGRVVWIGGTVD